MKMTNQPQTNPLIADLTVTELKLSTIETGHLAIGIWNGKTGEDSKQGVRHLYSDGYRERWPQDQYPEKYEEDVPVD